MVLEQRSPGVCATAGCFSQERQVERQFPDKCPKASWTTCQVDAEYEDTDCDRTGFPDLQSLGFAANFTKKPLAWNDVKSELDACSSFIYGWCVGGQCGTPPDKVSGHVMVAAAANVCMDGETVVPMVQVLNPAPCCIGKVSWVPYRVYSSGQVGTQFWANYHQIRRTEDAWNGAVDVAKCRRTTIAVGDQNATFSGQDRDALARRVLTGCGGSAALWQAAGLLDREPQLLSSDELRVGPALRRVVIPSVDFVAFLHDQKSFLDAKSLPRVWVYPVFSSARIVGAIALREMVENQFELESIDSASTARRLFENVAKLRPTSREMVEVVVPDTLLSLLHRVRLFGQASEYFGNYGTDCLPDRHHGPDAPWELEKLVPVVLPP
jgi:hypothetical protein